MKRKKTPEILNLHSTELDALKARVAAGSPLLDGDAKILISVLSTYQWLHRQLQSTKFTIHRLKKIFGFSTETRSSLKKKNLSDALLGQVETNADISPDSTVSNYTEPTTKKS